MKIPFLTASRERQRQVLRDELERRIRGATCIPITDAMVCAADHVFSGRFARNCPCGETNAFSLESTPLRAQLAAIKGFRARLARAATARRN